MILVSRVFQGLGGGGLAPVTQSMLADAFPAAKRGQAFSIFGLTVIAAPAVGPILGGYLTDNLSWHWIFLINLPIGLIAFTLISTFISEPPLLVQERKELLKGGLHFDYFGLFLVALGFGVLQIFLDKFQEDDGFSSPFILTCFCIVVVSLSLLAVWEWEHPYPVMNLRLFKYRNFAVGNVLLFFVGFVLLSSTQLLPQLTQSLLGYDSETSGLALAVGGMVTIGLMPVAGIITGRFVPAKPLMFFGFMEIGFSLLLQSSIVPDVNFATLSFFRVLQVIALPFVFIPVNSVCYVGIPPRNNGEASALVNQCRNLGSSIGISFVTTMLAWRTQFHHARLAESITPYGSLHQLSISQIAPIVQTQASFMSYLDMFRLIGFMAFAVCPFVLLLKTPSKQAAQGAPVGH
jgi:DHA2 family multidrug resistance protein